MAAVEATIKKYPDLSKLVDDADGNNFSEWEVKSRVKFQSYKLWSFIDGPTSNAPIIPVLRPRQQVEGEDLEGNETVFFIPGNEDEV